MFEPIVSQCMIVNGVAEDLKKVADLSFIFDDKKYNFSILPVLDQPIVHRENEPTPAIEDYIKEDQNFFYLENNISNYNWCYIYTRIGKLLVGKEFGFDQPRACAFSAAIVPNNLNTKNFAISKKYRVLGKFALLIPWLDDKPRGLIKVTIK
jgi:hypothetical protein